MKNTLMMNQKKEIISLAKNGLSLNKLSARYNIPKTTLYYHIKQYVKKYTKINLKNLSSWERGYVTGLFYGDGHLDVIKSTYSYRINFSFNLRTEEAIANKLITILEKANCKPFQVIFKKKSTLRVVCVSKSLSDYLRSFVVYKRVKKGKEFVNRKSYLRKFPFGNEGFAYGFVAGVIDSDGYVGLSKGTSPFAVVTTASKKFAGQFYTILESLNIRASLIKNKSDMCYYIRIWTESYNEIKNILSTVKGASGVTVTRDLRNIT